MEKSKLNGVIGVIANNPLELELAIKYNLDCIEIRADLLIHRGFSIGEICDVIKKSRLENLYSLFTVRHKQYGGKFLGTEQERIQIIRLAIEAGANCIDLEWGSEAELEMYNEDIPLLISDHNFHSMPTAQELEQLTLDIEKHSPLGVKIVPTASKVYHSFEILNWVKQGYKEKIFRIGFAMGSKGLCSRILATVYGSPITYAAFGEPVAPGQISIEKTINLYRVPKLSSGCFIFAVAGKNVNDSDSLTLMNNYLEKKNINAVSIPLEVRSLDELIEIARDLKICGVQLEPPLKEMVFRKNNEMGYCNEGPIFLEFGINNEQDKYSLLSIFGDEFLKKKYK